MPLLVSYEALSYHMGGCQNDINIRCRIIIRTQKGTLILTTTHIDIGTIRIAINNRLGGVKSPQHANLALGLRLLIMNQCMGVSEN